MAKMNWDRVRQEYQARRHGTEPYALHAADEMPIGVKRGPAAKRRKLSSEINPRNQKAKQIDRELSYLNDVI